MLLYVRTHLPLLWLPTHLVPVLWIQLQFFNQVACYLAVAFLGCPVQNGIVSIVFLMDLCLKHRRQELDHLQLPTLCSHVHGIVAILYRVTKQMAGHSKYKFIMEPRCEAILPSTHTRLDKGAAIVVLCCTEGEHANGQNKAVRT